MNKLWSIHRMDYSAMKNILQVNKMTCMNLEKIFSKSEAKWQLHSHVRLCGPMDCGPPGSPVHGVLQARTVEWVAMSFLGIGQ